MNEAAELFKYQEDANTAWEIFETMGDDGLDVGEKNEAAEHATQNKLLDKAEKDKVFVVADAMTAFKTQVKVAEKQAAILHYMNFLVGKRMVTHVVNIVTGAVAVTFAKSGFMGAHVAAAALDATLTAGSATAVWTGVGVTAAVAENWSKQHLIVETCPTNPKDHKSAADDVTKLLTEFVNEMPK